MYPHDSFLLNLFLLNSRNFGILVLESNSCDALAATVSGAWPCLSFVGRGRAVPDRRLSSGLASVTNVQFTDTDPTFLDLGGTVTWEEPTDMTGIHQYHVRMAWDLSDTAVKELVWSCMRVASPSNSCSLRGIEPFWGWDTSRQEDSGDLATYPASEYPMNWLLVVSTGAGGYLALGDPIQTVDEAAKLRLVDNQTTNLPTSLALDSLTFVDQTSVDKVGSSIQGILQWTTRGPDFPYVSEDWALADSFEVFLTDAGSLSTTLTRSLGTVSIGSSVGVNSFSLTIPETALSGADTLVVKASNSVGQAPLSAGQSEVYCLVCTTTTTTTATSSSSTASASTSTQTMSTTTFSTMSTTATTTTATSSSSTASASTSTQTMSTTTFSSGTSKTQTTTSQTTSSFSVGANGQPLAVVSDPITWYHGKKTKFWFPPGELLPFLETPELTVWASTFTGPTIDYQWFDRFVITDAGRPAKEAVDVQVLRPVPGANRSRRLGDFNQLYISMGGKALRHRVAHLFAAAGIKVGIGTRRSGPQAQSPLLEFVIVETASVSFMIHASPAGTEFPDDIQKQVENMHLDWINLDMSPNGRFSGILPQIWGMQPRSPEVESMLIAPSKQVKVHCMQN